MTDGMNMSEDGELEMKRKPNGKNRTNGWIERKEKKG